MHQAGMDHGDMDHGEMGQCKMNMLFTWSTKNLCIVFSTWRITGPVSLLLSLSVIVLLAAGYEGIRDVTRRFEASHARQLKAYSSPVNADYGETTIASDPSDRQGEMSPSTVPEFNGQHYEHHSINVSRTNANESSSLLLVVGRDSKLAFERRGKIIMALLYAIQVFYSFFIMLLFMTYNGWIMIAVAVGAFVGFLAFGGDSAAKSVACH